MFIKDADKHGLICFQIFFQGADESYLTVIPFNFTVQFHLADMNYHLRWFYFITAVLLQASLLPFLYCHLCIWNANKLFLLLLFFHMTPLRPVIFFSIYHNISQTNRIEEI